MEMPPPVTDQPPFDGRVLVCSIIVNNCMDLEVERNLFFNMLQECHKLLVTMLGFALSDDCTVGNIQSSKE